HALLAPLFAGFLLFVRRHWTHAGAAAILLLAAYGTISAAPYWYGAQGRFNTVFSKLLPTADHPPSAIAEVRLDPSDLALIGQHAFLPARPAFDPEWLGQFSHRGSYRDVLLYLLRHPRQAWNVLNADL